MLDAQVRKLIDPPLEQMGKFLAGVGVNANFVTVSGFVIGMMSIPLLALQFYTAALVPILINRFFDGLDGAIAKQSGQTDFGGYLDIVLDFIFYSGVVFGVALGRPDEAVFAAFLIYSFIGSGSSFLAFAIIAAKHDLTTEVRGTKSIYYLGGLAEGTETIITLLLICLLPTYFPLIAVVFGFMCWITTVARIRIAMLQIDS